MDDPQKFISTALTGNPSVADDQNLPVTTPASDEYEVDLWWVKDVKPGDAAQAEATMKALVNAGLKPRMVAHALEKGHGYKIESLVTKQRLTNLSGRMGELAVSQQAVGAYEIVERAALGTGEKPLEAVVEETGLTRAEVITDLASVRRKGESPQKIEMTVVVKQEPPKQIENNDDKIQQLRGVV